MTGTISRAMLVFGLTYLLVTAAAGRQTIASGQPGPRSSTSASGPDKQSPVPDVPQEDDSAEADDEELQQLIAQAETLAGPDSPASVETIALIGEELEGLKAALATKASLVDAGQDTTEADLEIASHSETLRAAVAGVAEQDPSAEPSTNVDNARAERTSLAAKIDSYVGDALDLLSKIRELLVIARDERGGTIPEPTADRGVFEEALETVSGVVTASGEPVEGVSVTDPDSGVTAVTNSDGQYTLEGLPAGRSATLALEKGGKSIGEGRIELTPGHDAVGDFELRPSAGRAQPSLRVMPSVAVVTAGKTNAGISGSMRGTVRDANGRPVSRALVMLGGMTRARTDSKGQFAFLRVPPGTYDLKVFRIGVPTETRRVRVAAKRNDAMLTLAARSSKRSTGGSALIRRGLGTELKGVVTSAGGPPIRAAKVLLIRSGQAVFVRSGARGDFRFADIDAGRYRVLVSKPGYQALADVVSLEPGTGRVRNYQLKRTADGVRTASRPRAAGAARPGVRTGAAATTGRVVGRVFDAATRRPIAGALVMLSGHDPVAANRAGIYRILDVAPARQLVVVKKAGFETLERDIHVSRGKVVRLDFALSPASSPKNRRRPPHVDLERSPVIGDTI